MKVRRLWIGEYRVLRDIEIVFSPDPAENPAPTAEPAARSPHALDLLVGVNGTGKSTALHALVEVLHCIEGRASVAEVQFRITYERQAGEVVTVSNVDEEKKKLVGRFRVWKGGETQFQEMDDVRHLAPPLYVTYTTGRETPRAVPDADVAPHLLASASAGDYWLREREGDAPVLASAPAGDPPTLTTTRSHYEITAQDLPLVALCGLLQNADPAASNIVGEALEDLGMKGPSAFALRLDAPSEVRDDALRNTIDQLRKSASRVRVQGTRYTFVFDVRREAEKVLAAVSAAFRAESPVGLFRELAAQSRPQAGYPAVLSRVDLFIERKPLVKDGPAPALHTYDWLSDGERTFLSRMCLLALFGAGNALILLDEPEVHFNDYWKRKLVHLVDRALDQRHSHAIVTTHSSIVLTDARLAQIHVLERSDDGYTRRPLPPGVPTFAGDPSDVLVNVFGAEAAAGAKSVDEVREALDEFESLLRRKRLTEALQARLQRLHKELGPGYWRFRVADALSRWKG